MKEGATHYEKTVAFVLVITLCVNVFLYQRMLNIVYIVHLVDSGDAYEI